MSGVNTMLKDGGWEKIPKEDLPAPSSVSAAFPASWLLLEYEDGCLAGCPHLTGSRIFKSSTSSTTAQPHDV